MIRTVYEEAENKVVAYDDDVDIGECTYSQSEGLWIIDHTFVDDEYKGRGIGKKLVKKLVDEGRKQDIKIFPLCPFAKKEFDKNKEYMDILYK